MTSQEEILYYVRRYESGISSWELSKEEDAPTSNTIRNWCRKLGVKIRENNKNKIDWDKVKRMYKNKEDLELVPDR